jgi:hypothetical protein
MATSVSRPDTKKLEQTQIVLRGQYDAITVKDAETCLKAKTLMRDIRLEMKMRHAVLDPFVAIAKKNYDDAKDERAKYIDPLQTMDDSLGLQVKDFERRERERAAAEERRINEERQRLAAIEAARIQKEAWAAAKAERERQEKLIKDLRAEGELNKREAEKAKKEAADREARAKAEAAEQAKLDAHVEAIKVQPNLSAVAGVPSRVNWRFRVVDRLQVPEQYWMLNEQMIGADVRRDKDKTNIPGIEIFCE